MKFDNYSETILVKIVSWLDKNSDSTFKKRLKEKYAQLLSPDFSENSLRDFLEPLKTLEAYKRDPNIRNSVQELETWMNETVSIKKAQAANPAYVEKDVTTRAEDQAKRMKEETEAARSTVDFYEILGINRNEIDIGKIEKAIRDNKVKAAKENDGDLVMKIVEARRFLLDKELRNIYDRSHPKAGQRTETAKPAEPKKYADKNRPIDPKLKNILDQGAVNYETGDDYRDRLKEMIQQQTLALSDVIYVVEEGPDKGKSLLYYLAGQDETDLFLQVLNRYNKQIPPSIFLTRIFQSEWGELSVFDFCLSRKGHPELAQAVWAQCKENITLDDLITAGKPGSFHFERNMSPPTAPLKQLISLGVGVKNILKDILKEKQGTIPQWDFADIKELARYDKEMLSLVEEREKMQPKSKPSW